MKNDIPVYTTSTYALAAVEVVVVTSYTHISSFWHRCRGL